jgi:beta-barrel assembly-enhancing protease
VLAAIVTLAAAGGILLSRSRTEQAASLDSVTQLTTDLTRDVSQVALVATRLSDRREIEIGKEIEAKIARTGWLKDDSTLQAYVTSVAEALLAHTRRKAITYRFHLLGSSAINAFAVPGGGIYVTTGMIDFLSSEAELAAVLGHEIAHVDLKHCVERLQYQVAARKIGGDDLAAIVSLGSFLVGIGYSSQQELEADAQGVLFAAAAGYDPTAARSAFQRLALREPKTHVEKPTLMSGELAVALGKALQQYFATHPPTEIRIRELETLFARNARTWRGRTFYLGRWNYQERIPRSHSDQPNERRPY